MTTAEFFSAIAALSGVTFVVAGMLGTGLSLTVAQILGPLKNTRLVILALLANFVLVPLLAYGITLVIPLDEPLEIGLLVLATVAGAPFLVKEVQAAKGDLPMGVGLMFLLMVVTIVYVPLVLPLLLEGVDVNAWDIAKSLIVTMLVPIVVGLMYRAHSPEGAAHWAPIMNKTSGVALIILLVTGVGVNASNIVDLVGSGGFAALILFVVGSLAIGSRHGRARSGRPQRAWAGHGATQRGGGHPGRQHQLPRHDDASVRARGLHRAAADPAADGAPDGPASRTGRGGGARRPAPSTRRDHGTKDLTRQHGSETPMNDTAMDELGPIDYLVVEFPADKADFSGAMAAKLKELVETGTIRVLDLLIITKETDGKVDAFEVHDFEDDSVGALREFGAELAELLSEEDVGHIAAALEPGTVAAALVWENTWAAPFAGLDPPLGRPARRQRPHPHAGDPRRRRGARGCRRDGRSLRCRLDQDAEDRA